MKAILFILFPLIIFNFDLSKYSINKFIEYLEETGYYEVISNIKSVLGDDMAIDVCKEFVKSNDCEVVIRTYMIIAYSRQFDFEEEAKEKQKEPEPEPKKIGLYELIHQDENLNVLKKFYTEKEIKTSIFKILKKRILIEPKKYKLEIKNLKDKYV